MSRDTNSKAFLNANISNSLLYITIKNGHSSGELIMHALANMRRTLLELTLWTKNRNRNQTKIIINYNSGL